MKAPQLVLLHGREKAREMVAPEQRRLIDIAAEVLGDESQGVASPTPASASPGSRTSDCRTSSLGRSVATA
jgi:hypothetical protein